MSKKILLVYSYSSYPPLQAIYDYIYAYRKHTDHKVYYLNLYFKSLAPMLLRQINFDAVLFHETLAKAPDFKIKDYIETLREFDFSNCTKVGFFQDEWFDTDTKCTMITSLNMDYVFTCSREKNWKKIYDKVNHSKVKFFEVFPGYVNQLFIKKINRESSKIERNIDIGYRASVTPKRYFYGSYYLNKKKIGTVFKKACKGTGIKTDISANPDENINGFGWFKYLLKCKYVLGIEGGVNILYRDNSIQLLAEKYLREHPNASFDEVKANYFQHLDGNLDYYAISPRHFEAIMTKTCQILMEGEYSGVLKPGIHYIELKKDYSNVQEVIEMVKQDRLREAIVDEAYRDIVLSEKYTYQTYVNFVMDKIGIAEVKAALSLKEKSIYYLSRVVDFLNWCTAFVFSTILYRIYRTASKILPGGLIISLRKFLKV